MAYERPRLFTYKVRLYPRWEQGWFLISTSLKLNQLYNKLIESHPSERAELTNAAKSEAPHIHDIAWNNVGRRIDQAYKVFNNRNGVMGKPATRRLFEFFTIFIDTRQAIIANGTLKVFDNEFQLNREDNIIKNYNVNQQNLRSLKITKDKDRRFYLEITLTKKAQKWKAKLQPSNTILGIDINKKEMLALSNGVVIPEPPFKEHYLKAIHSIKLSVSKASGTRRKIRLQGRLAKTEEKYERKTRDYLHKATALAASCSPTIAIEDLDMTDNKYKLMCVKLVKHLEDKAQQLIKVDPAYTSQTCSHCGEINRQMRDLSNRMFNCTRCGTELLRDHNAAINIAKKAKVSMQTNGWAGPVMNGKAQSMSLNNMPENSRMVVARIASETVRMKLRNLLWEAGCR